jgi:hypothetical protein
VCDNIPPGAGTEKEARKGFLWLLEEETTKDPFEQISAIDIVALFPASTMSNKARYRPLKERLIDGSDQVRKQREDTRLSFSATRFTALFNYACGYFIETINQLFNFIRALRTYNPITPDLEEYLSTFLKYVRTLSELTKFAVLIIASSFFLDNYPSDAHSKWALLLST